MNTQEGVTEAEESKNGGNPPMSENSLTAANGGDKSSKHAQKGQRRRLFLAFGALIILGVPAHIEFFLRRPVGSGPAGPHVEAPPFASHWTERPVVLLGLGDSVTRGLGADSKSHTFFERLCVNPTDEFPDMQDKCLSVVLPNLATENHAVSGSTSLEHLRILEEQITPFDEDVFGLVVMTTGGNDLIHSYGRRAPEEGAMYGATLSQAIPWIENFETRLEKIIQQIDSKFATGFSLFLADIYDPTDGVGDAPSIFLPPWPDGLAIHARYNEVIRQVADRHENVFVVPLHQNFLGHGSHCRQFWRSSYDASDPHYWFFTNIEDPNDRGYDAIRRVFLNTIIHHRNESIIEPTKSITPTSVRSSL